MSAIVSIVAGLFGKLIAPLFALFDRMRQDKISRERGRAEQRAADLEAGMREARDANKARGSVGGSDSDVDRLLRPPGSRGGS